MSTTLQHVKDELRLKLADKILSSTVGRKVTRELAHEDLQQRKAWVTERDKLAAERVKADAQHAKAEAAAVRAEADLKAQHNAANEALVAARAERNQTAFSFENRIAALDRQLRADADPAIDDFMRELRDLGEAVRREGVRSGQEHTPEGGIRHLSNKASLETTLSAIGAARQLAEELKLQAVEDLEAEFGRIRAAIPPVGDPVVVATESYGELFHKKLRAAR